MGNVFEIVRKWWWLMVLATVVAGASTYVVVQQQPLLYSTRSTLLVGPSLTIANPSDRDLRLSEQLAALYSEIATREPVREDTREALGLNQLPEYFVTLLPNSQLIEIVVTDTNPVRAQAVANELANQLIQRTPASSAEENQERKAFVQEQLAYLESKIEETEADLERSQAELGELESAREIADKEIEIQGFENKLTSLQSIYASLLSTTSVEALNSLSVIEPAALPRQPDNPSSNLMILLGGIAGLAIAVAGALLIEGLDHSIKTPQQAVEALHLPIMGMIGKMSTERLNDGGINRSLITDGSRAREVEAFRNLRTNLMFASVDTPLKKILVASPGPEDGKSTIATNLALAMAKSEQKVLLVDGDLRKPSLHKLLDVREGPGLSDIFLEDLPPGDAVSKRVEDGLLILTGGDVPPNPTELLASRQMDAALRELSSIADYMVIDSPPFVLADASVLASKVDGVVLVVRPGHTQLKEAETVIEQLRRVDANVIGMVLNRVPTSQIRSAGREWGGYAYHSGRSGGERWMEGLAGLLDRIRSVRPAEEFPGGVDVWEEETN